jgi:hypothetical protein
VNAVTIKEERYIEISNRFEALENMDDNVDLRKYCRKYQNFSPKESR